MESYPFTLVADYCCPAGRGCTILNYYGDPPLSLSFSRRRGIFDYSRLSVPADAGRRSRRPSCITYDARVLHPATDISL
jgi:hypothetical protein